MKRLTFFAKVNIIMILNREFCNVIEKNIFLMNHTNVLMIDDYTFSEL